MGKAYILLVSLLILISFLLFKAMKSYEPEIPTKCDVLDSYQTSAGYKVSAKFILILQDERGRVFDIKVSPTMYYKGTTNGKLNLMLRDSEISGEISRFAGWLMSMILSLFLFALSIVYTLEKWEEKKNGVKR